MGQTITVPLGELDATPLLVPVEQLQIADAPSSSSALWFQGASKVLPAAEKGVRTALASPNAPRIIQRAIGAGVRGVSTAAGAAVGGVPGAVGGAAMSEGLTPTQQTIRGWLGRTSIAQPSAPSGDAVVNYIESMGGSPSNLRGATLEYATKAGRPVLYDASGAARLVPTAESTAVATPTKAASKFFVGKLARGLSAVSGVQGALDVAQMAEPGRRDIGFLGMGASPTGPTPQAFHEVNARRARSGLPAITTPEDFEANAMREQVEAGVNPMKAAATLASGDTKKFAQLITDYSKSVTHAREQQTIKVGFNGGRDMQDIPLMVPTLTNEERAQVLSGAPLSHEIIDKAARYHLKGR